MRLVDDHRVMLADDRLLHGIQGEQRVVGDDDVGGARLGDGLLRPALLHERTPRSPCALLGRDRIGGPHQTRHVLQLVAVTGCGLIGPLHHPLRLALRIRVVEGLLVGVFHTLGPCQAQVVATTLQRRERNVPRQVVDHTRHGPWHVPLDQLVLQREGRSRDHHPTLPLWALGGVHHRGHEIPHRLTGTGAGLDQHRGVFAQRLLHQVDHLLLPGPLRAPQIGDNGVEELPGGGRHHPSLTAAARSVTVGCAQTQDCPASTSAAPRSAGTLAWTWVPSATCSIVTSVPTE